MCESDDKSLKQLPDYEAELVDSCEPAPDASAEDESGRVHGKARKKGVAWNEAEHKQFLAGLQKLGKGDWRGIAQQFVTTRTPTQVASHAQKHFIRRINNQSHKRRSSLFDLDSDSLEQAPSQRHCPTGAADHSSDTQQALWRGCDLSSSYLESFPRSQYPAVPGNGEASYQMLMQQQVQAAAAAGYALGSQAACLNSRDGQQNSMVSDPAIMFNTQQQVMQMAYMHYQQAAAAMAAHPADSMQPPPLSFNQDYAAACSLPDPFMMHPAWGMQPRRMARGCPAAGKTSIAECCPDDQASSGHKGPVYSPGASLGLNNRRYQEAEQEGSRTDGSHGHDQQRLLPKVIKVKARHAQPSAGTQAGYGCEPLLKCLASISKPSAAASLVTTSEASNRSSRSAVLHFDGNTLLQGWPGDALPVR